jgi:transglutaminase-like putative cysteine protease
MADIFLVRHLTHYRYARPVQFGEHRLMVRPHDSHDIRLLNTSLRISPTAAVHYYHDPFHNSIAIARFNEAASELICESLVRIAHFGVPLVHYDLEAFARRYPFVYDSDEFPDLMTCIERHYPDPGRKIYDWARQFLPPSGRIDTLELLRTINSAIKNTFTYCHREELGTLRPQQTLERMEGSCRDYALFMMEAVRSLGLAARFVSGYVYDPASDGTGRAAIGAGSTHAWVQIYLPGAGWTEFDPTNDMIGGKHLIRVGVARDPSQILPVVGSFTGAAEDFLGMKVEVSVTRE